jgi:phospholipid transport system substrate-binding protein
MPQLRYGHTGASKSRRIYLSCVYTKVIRFCAKAKEWSLTGNKELEMSKVAFLIVATILVISGPTVAQEESAEVIVHTAISEVVAALKNPDLEEAARREAVSKSIISRFDFEAMAQRILATNWRKTSEEQREQFVDLFQQILSNTYWSKIKVYSDEEIIVLDTTVRDDRFAVVETRILLKDKNIPIDYKLYRNRRTNSWVAYDVVIEQNSLIQNYRSTFSEIVEKDGIDGLIADMKKRAKKGAAA